MGDDIQFYLDGRLVAASGVDAQTTLLDYLRECCGSTGVKEGCAEGDCGACTVVIGTLAGSTIRWRAVNACIRLLATVDGTEILTAQGLAQDDGQLHPAQQSMVDHHGSQCGFCTPGFVMSLFALYEDTQGGKGVDRSLACDALSGNLCRCTGYRPIIDAAMSMDRYPAPRSGVAAHLHSSERVQRLRDIQKPDGLRLPGFTAPRDLATFADRLAAEPESLVLAGGTDVGLWVTKQLRRLPPVLYLGGIDELDRTVTDEAGMRIGAAVSLEQAFASLTDWFPHLRELAQRFASRPIRNSGTLCGNLANGSPIGDALPALIALDARLELRRGGERRSIALEDFYLAYQKKDLRPGEFVEAVTVPRSPPQSSHAVYKVSKRIDQDISAVCAGIRVTLENGLVSSARIAFGGMAPTARRASLAESALTGATWDLSSVRKAMEALEKDFTPIGDMRASRAYRSVTAANLLMRFWLESSAHLAVRIGQVAAQASQMVRQSGATP